eukprot:3281867-Lingulodinium_polyedra.AAC.2
MLGVLERGGCHLHQGAEEAKDIAHHEEREAWHQLGPLGRDGFGRGVRQKHRGNASYDLVDQCFLGGDLTRVVHHDLSVKVPQRAHEDFAEALVHPGLVGLLALAALQQLHR